MGLLRRNIRNIFLELFILFFFSVLYQCQATSAEELSEYEEQYFCTRSFLKPVARAEDGYYMLCSDYLYYLPDGYQEAVPVCGKPECDHQTTKCDAFVGYQAWQLAYFQKNIYAFALNPMDGTETLHEISGDGATHTRLLTVEERNGNFLASVNGCIYYIIDSMSSDKQSSFSLWEYDIASSEAAQLAEMDGTCVQLFPDRSSEILWLVYSTMNDEKGSEECLVGYDYKEGQLGETTVKETDHPFLHNATLVCSDKEQSVWVSNLLESNRMQLYSVRWDTLDMEELFQIPSTALLAADDDYLFFCADSPEQTEDTLAMEIWSWNGKDKFSAELEHPEGPRMGETLIGGATGGYLFYVFQNIQRIDGMARMVPSVTVFDKSSVESDQKKTFSFLLAPD